MSNVSLWFDHLGNTHSKKQIVFLHGWSLHSDVWLPLLPFFQEDYHITLIDLPGHGRSRTILWPEQIEELIDQIALLIDKNAIVVGWSLGGLIETLLAEKHPQKINALVTIGCNPCFVCRDDWLQAMPIAVFNQFEEALKSDAEHLLQQFVGLVCKDDAKVRTINKELKKLLCKYGKSDIASLTKALLFLKETDLRSYLKNIKQPTLHLFGEYDVLVPVKAVDQLRVLFAEHQIKIINDTAHIPFYSQPLVVADEINCFINQMQINNE